MISPGTPSSVSDPHYFFLRIRIRNFMRIRTRSGKSNGIRIRNINTPIYSQKFAAPPPTPVSFPFPPPSLAAASPLREALQREAGVHRRRDQQVSSLADLGLLEGWTLIDS